jgi:hypothetical protein
MAMHIYTNDYIRMEITVLYFENFTASIVDFMVASKLNLPPSNLQLMP